MREIFIDNPQLWQPLNNIPQVTLDNVSALIPPLPTSTNGGAFNPFAESVQGVAGANAAGPKGSVAQKRAME